MIGAGASLAAIAAATEIRTLYHANVSVRPGAWLVFGVAWLVGRDLRRRRRQAADLRTRAALAEREREEKARVAVAEERSRIARELHDVVAHSVSVMVVQAQAGPRLLGDPEQAQAAFRSIEGSGREALVELRRLLGILRMPDEQAGSRPPARPGLPRLARRPGARGRARSRRPRRGRAGAAAPRDRSLRVPDRSGSADQHAQARGDRTGGDRGPLRPLRRRGRGLRRRTGRAERRQRHRARADRDARAGRPVRRLAPTPARDPGAATRSGLACRSREPAGDDPRPDRRRPGAGAHRVSRHPRRGARHHRGRRGRRRARGGGGGAVASRGRGRHGHPHAGHGRHRGHATDRGQRRRRPAHPHPHHLRSRRVRVRGPPRRSQRVPAEGRRRRRAAPRRARGGRRRRAPGPVDHPPAHRGLRQAARRRRTSRRP